MIRVDINYRDNKIIGYNKIFPDQEKLFNDDAIFTDGEQEEKIVKDFRNGNLYYISGQVVEQEPDVQQEDRMKELCRKITECSQVMEKFKGDNFSLLENLAKGLSMEEMIAEYNQSKERKEELETEIESLTRSIEDEEKNAIEEKLEKEEDGLNYKYFLSGVTVVRDENDYIEEWLRYHIEDIGFDHFYIYDNESSLAVRDYLESTNFKYLDKLTIIPWETSQSLQTDINNNFLKTYGKETEWAINFDVDEYIVIKQERGTLKEILKGNHTCYKIRCLWHYFNANGLVKKTEGTDMERFTKECDFPGENNIGKVFFRTNKIKYFLEHEPILRDFFTDAKCSLNDTENLFRMNHYITRSFEEWNEKMKKGSCSAIHGRRFSDFFKLNPDMEYLDTGEDYEQEYAKKQ